MSLGGDFYAVSPDHMTKLLDGTMDFEAYRSDELEERPGACFADAEFIWYELTQMFADEDVCGAENSETIAEQAMYNLAPAVPSIATSLAALSDEELLRRYRACAEERNADTEDGETLKVLRGLVAFYQAAASNGHAVLFHVT